LTPHHDRRDTVLDIDITTTDPHQVSANEIIDALDAIGYPVDSIRVRDRSGSLDSAIGHRLELEQTAAMLAEGVDR
jgi:hypothetical protein